MNSRSHSSPEFRRTIPHGKCVTPEAGDESVVENFYLLDKGIGDPAEHEVATYIAQTACGGCVQADYCASQRLEIARALWSEGAGAVVVGGELLKEERQELEQSSLWETSLRFELSDLPKQDAPWRAYTLRQAIRSGQLTLESNKPNVAREAAREFVEATKGDATYRHWAQDMGSESKIEKVVANAATLLFQLSDFANFSQGKRTNQRSSSVGEGHDELYEQFLNDAAAIARLGLFARAEALVFYHSPHYYEKLRAFHVGGWVTPGDFAHVAQNESMGSPHEALLGYAMRCAVLAEYSRRNSLLWGITTIRRKAKSPDSFAEIGMDAQGFMALHTQSEETAASSAVLDAPLLLSPAKPKSGQTPRSSGSTPSSRANRPKTQGVDHFEQHAASLAEMYCGKDYPPGVIRSFAREGRWEPSLVRAQAAAEFYTQNLEDYKGLLRTYNKDRLADGGKLHSVPDTFLREIADRKQRFVSAEEIIGEHEVKKMTMRHRARADRNGHEHLERWIYHRAVALCGIETAGSAADMVYNFYNVTKILVIGGGGLSVMHDKSVQWMVERVCDPGSQKRLSYTSEMNALSGPERFAVAYHYRFAHLVYGGDIIDKNQDVLCRALGVPDLHKYVEDVLWPRIDSLAGRAGKREPLSLAQLSEDIREVLAFQEPASRIPISAVSAAAVATVVGAEVAEVQASIEPVFFEELDPEHRAFVWYQVRLHVPPAQQRYAAAHVALALDLGILEISNSFSQGMLLQFTRPLRSLPEFERTVLAYFAGVDFLTHRGEDVQALIRPVVDELGLRDYLKEQLLPRIEQIMGDEQWGRRLAVRVRDAQRTLEMGPRAIEAASKLPTQQPQNDEPKVSVIGGEVVKDEPHKEPSPAAAAPTSEPQTAVDVPARPEAESDPDPFKRITHYVTRLIDLADDSALEPLRERIIAHFQQQDDDRDLPPLSESEAESMERFLLTMRADYLDVMERRKKRPDAPKLHEATLAMVELLLGRRGSSPRRPKAFQQAHGAVNDRFKRSFNKKSVAEAVAEIFKVIAAYREREIRRAAR